MESKLKQTTDMSQLCRMCDGRQETTSTNISANNETVPKTVIDMEIRPKPETVLENEEFILL